MKQAVIHANVFDGRGSSLIENTSIIIENDLVTEITQQEIALEQFDHIIDAGGRTVLPGLVDSHAHLSFTAPVVTLASMRQDEFYLRSARYAAEMLQRGFTTVRDAGGATVGLKACIDNGFLPGPRIFPSVGAISQTSGHSDVRIYRSEQIRPPETANTLIRTGMFVIADGVDEVLRACREQLFLGASQIKIMAGGGMGSYFDPLDTLQFTLEEMKAAVAAASDYGTYVMAHLYTPQQMARAAEAGVRSFEHGTLMDEETARRMADYGIWLCVCPQFGGNGGIPVARSKPAPIPVGTLPNKKKKTLDEMRKGLERQAELVDKYRLPIAFGTDAFREEQVGDEPADRQLGDLRNYKKFFGNLRGLQAITGNACDLYQLCTYQNPYPNGKIGVLEESSYADLCIVDGNPLEDLEVLCDPANMRLVMKGGAIYHNTL